ncbi:Conserved_hypothetical protein [Hexamita inflata]|uniref:Uncharacterized protein n=1 Tax=Hexamita inflata TaxID=28002 RepID=A0AA86P2B3_9EUKA|nr:Conserved hypothetical protein [Hexamita inflata]
MDEDFGILKVQSTDSHNIKQKNNNNAEERWLSVLNNLNSQVYFNISTTICTFQNKLDKKQSLTKKDVEMLRIGLPFPQTNSQYSFFLPQSLENQFLTRFPNNRFSYVFENDINNLSVVQMLNKQIVKSQHLNETNFQERYQDSVRIVTNFDQACKNTNQKVVLLLLDFHQHPLTVVHFINFLTKCQFQVVCPYLPDVFIKSAMINPEQSIRNIFNIISEIKNILIFHPFNIIAHGISVPIGLQIHQLYGMECQKVILCNPIINFKNISVVTNEIQNEAQNIVTCNLSRTVEFSLEPINRVTYNKQHSEPSTIQFANTVHRLQLKKKNSKLKKNENIQLNRSVQHFQNRTFSLIEQMIQPDQDQEQNYLDDIVQLINSKVKNIYKDVSLLSGLIKAHDVNHLSDLEIVADINKFFSINSFFATVSHMFRTFLRKLYSLFVFSPLEQLEQYHIYKNVFDRHFFESFSEMKIFLETNTTTWIDDMNLYNLISSHDCLISEDFLQDMRDSKANFKKMHCRTIIGAGHDLLSVAGNVIEKLLK